MERKVTISDKEMTLRATALLPRQYRFHFGRDLIHDMKSLINDVNASKESGKEIEISSFEMFEDLAWLMFKAGGEDVGNSVDEWLESLEDVFVIYEIATDIVELWGASTKQLSKPKKK